MCIGWLVICLARVSLMFDVPVHLCCCSCSPTRSLENLLYLSRLTHVTIGPCRWQRVVPRLLRSAARKQAPFAHHQDPPVRYSDRYADIGCALFVRVCLSVAVLVYKHAFLFFCFFLEAINYGVSRCVMSI